MNINREFFEQLIPLDTFGRGRIRYDCIINNMGVPRKIIIFANNFDEVVSKVSLRFGFVVNKYLLNDNIYMLELINKLECYVYEWGIYEYC